MEKELTEYETLCILSHEDAIKAKEIMDKWKGRKMPGRDGGDTQELRELNKEGGRRYCKIKEMYMNHETLPESEVMKIVKGEF